MNIVPNLTFSIDPNVVMAIITVVAVISPIATALIDNLFQYHREKIQHYELAKRQALIEFIKCASDFHQNNNSSTSSALHSSMNNLYIYFSDICIDPYCFDGVDDFSFFLNMKEIVVNLSKQISKK